MKKLYSIILTTIVICSCSKDLNPQTEGFLMGGAETVNGFDVRWSDFMTEEQRQVIRDILCDMVPVHGGTFTMGASQDYDPSARANEGPQHIVKLSDYYICVHELTRRQVDVLTQTTRSGSSPIQDYQGQYVFYSWEDWDALLAILKDLTGLPFDFPTEAQWEYAARGGQQSKGYLYPGSNVLSEVWSSVLDETNTSKPNELGLFNMADKNSEWCKDFCQPYEDVAMQENPCVMFGKEHVVKGGCHISNSEYKRWLTSKATDTSNSFFNSLVDWRLCRSTARTYSSGRHWDISCRPVIYFTEAR